MDPDTWEAGKEIGKVIASKHGKKMAGAGLLSAGAYVRSQVLATKEETEDITNGELSPRQFDRKHGHGRYEWIKESMDQKERNYIAKYIKKHGRLSPLRGVVIASFIWSFAKINKRRKIKIGYKTATIRRFKVNQQ
jgi:hypothetical protein